MDVLRDACRWGLTDKEKQTLRLMVRGHDAKSIARSLGLSVHTINERLREARRKMAVSSSREAARLLLEAEDGLAPASPENRVDTGIGEDPAPMTADPVAAPPMGAGWAGRPLWIVAGALTMMIALSALAFAVLPPSGALPVRQAATDPVPANAEVVQAALNWLSLVDQGKWDESYRGTTAAFRKLNSAKTWASVSERVRPPLGAVLSRTLLRQENLPAPPGGYEVVKFRTSFANKADAIETVTLEQGGGMWRVAGVTIE
ncbi:DUF4019 domain-containing protein [Sphingomonas sp. RS6]